MASPNPPRKVWLMLSLAVLLLHLALLQTVPLSLSSVATHTPSVSFAMRTLTPEPLNTDITSAAPATQPRAKPRLQPRPAPQPNTAPQTGVQPLPALDAVAPAEASPAGEIKSPEPTQTALAEAAEASAPKLSEPEATPRPPREKAANLNVSGVPGAVKLTYKVEANKFPYSLSGELVWAHEGTRYVASLSFGAFGQTRTQTSRGLIGPEGLMPERFSDKFRSEMAAHFNREQGKVTFSANTPDAALLQGGQDRLSVLIQLAALVASAPERFAPATTLTLQTIGPRDADLWLFTVGNLETLELPGGTVQGLKLTRNPRQLYDQQVDIWLAPALGYLPARIRITEANGDYIDQKWAASEPASLP